MESVYQVSIVLLNDSCSHKLVDLFDKLPAVKYSLLLVDEKPKVEPTHIIVVGNLPTRIDKLPDWILNSNVPVLGIGHAAVLLALHLGGSFHQTTHTPRYHSVMITRVFNKKQSLYKVFINNTHKLVNMPSDFITCSVTKHDYIVEFTDYSHWWGILFHPEEYMQPEFIQQFLDMTTHGRLMTLMPSTSLSSLID